jgi:transposase InsO family protein
MTNRRRRIYDHRIKEQIVRSRNPNLFPELRIPASTARSWIQRGLVEVVSLHPDNGSEDVLRDRITSLESRVRILSTLLRLTMVLVRISGCRLDRHRLPDASAKPTLLHAVERARRSMPLSAVLRVLHLSPSRYHAWVRAEQGCDLEDQPSCPRSTPHRLTPEEVGTMKEMVTSADCRHMSIRALALHAQRMGKVFAHPATWAKLIRERKWLRPRLRVYPAKPKIGVRGDRPNAAWHVDCTILKLLDGSKAYVHAVIDNFSRRILAWTVDDRINPGSTCRILLAAAKSLVPGLKETDVFMDGGGENVNSEVDGLFDVKPLRRILAQVDVSYSNSLIEAWWRSLRHQWLYLNSLDTLATVRRLVGWYVREHNEVLPHAAFDGQTPDEVYFGRGADVPERLTRKREEARQKRLERNREATCSRCPRSGEEGLAA